MHDALGADDQRTVEAIERLCSLAQAAVPGEAVPCFARLQVQSQQGVRDHVLGFRTVTEGAITILNWQTAPMASVFFTCRVGDPYELKIAGRSVEGTVLSRDLIEFEAGRVVEIVTADAVLSRRDAGVWRRIGDAYVPLLRARQPGSQRAPSPWTVEALDATQRAAVSLPRGRALLVVGEAGCGKTTVALHRLAALRKESARAARPFRALVLVPVEGLRRLSESLLQRYGAPDVDVRVFDRWAAVQARRAFPGIPRRESVDAPPAVSRFKRHPAVRAAIDEIAARPRERPASRGGVSRTDLLYLFGDQDLLERAAVQTEGGVSGHVVRQLREHTRVQFNDRTEQEYAHVDAERLATVDGRLIDAGTPMENAGSIDVEDYAVLFALAARRATTHGAVASPERYDCIVIDEAQEFAPLELELIGRALAPRGTLIVAGDEGQQVDPTTYFAGWAASMRELGVRAYETVRLEVSYRCPPSVTRFARALLDPSAPRPVPHALAPDGSVVAYRAPTECHLVARLVDALREVRLSDASATVAVVMRTPAAAERMAALLRRGLEVHLERDGDFRFEPGIEVTSVQAVKGLEFDHVVVPDASGGVYANEPDARRALYVAGTRASFQLALATVAGWSAIVAD